MEERARADRHESILSPDIMRSFRIEQSAWHEDPEDIAKKIAWGKRKAFLLAWVREQMEIRLTQRERHCIELYYFRGLTYREAGAATNTNASSVYRAVQRSIRKLREAAKNSQLLG
jgi:RNA polymerase sigma factor (sigma-70 family)